MLLERGTAVAVDTTAQNAMTLWASMMTGVTATAHGIHDAFEVRPDGGGLQPVGASAWRAAPLWRVLADAGAPSAAVSCPGTVPATAWPGCTVLDERFASAPALPEADWPLPPGCVEPPGMRNAVRPMRVDPSELDDAVRGTLPARPLAYAVSVHAAALAVAAQDTWRFLAVCYPPLDGSDAAHAFMDMLLDRLIGAAGDGVDVVVVSDAGVMLAAGPGFAADRIVHGAAPMDVAATVLARFGLAVAGGQGRVLDGTRHGALQMVPGTMPPRTARSAIAPPAEAVPLIDELEARCFRHAALEAVLLGDHAGAVPQLQEGLRHRPGDLGMQLLLAQSAFLLGDAGTCRAIGETLASEHPGMPWGPLLVGAALALQDDPAADASLHQAEALAGTMVDAWLRLGAIALRRGRTGDARRHYGRALALTAGTPDLQAGALTGLGLARLAEGDTDGAARDLQAALGHRYHAPAVHHQLGLLHAGQARWVEADRALRTALAQAPGLPGVAEALSRVERAVGRLVVGQPVQ